MIGQSYAFSTSVRFIIAIITNLIVIFNSRVQVCVCLLSKKWTEEENLFDAVQHMKHLHLHYTSSKLRSVKKKHLNADYTNIFCA